MTQTEVTKINLPALLVRDGQSWADSRDVARSFGKTHGHVLRDITEAHCSADFRRSNFGLVTKKRIKNNKIDGETTLYVRMTYKGFAFVALGWTGEKAGRFKEAYIEKFEESERIIRGMTQPAAPAPAALSPEVAAMLQVTQEITRTVAALVRTMSAKDAPRPEPKPTPKEEPRTGRPKARPSAAPAPSRSAVLKKVTRGKFEAIQGLHKDGVFPTAIARAVGLSAKTVRRVIACPKAYLATLASMGY